MRLSFTRAKNFLFSNHLLLFITTAVLVCSLQFALLKIILKFGISSEDWLLLFDYKTIGGDKSFLDKLAAVFNAKGIYSTTFMFYIGILESFFKENSLAYQLTNLTFKTIATLSLFPLVLIIFKRKLLAVLTTILYAISYSSTGSLQFVVKGSDYLAISFMNISLITYYLAFNTKKKIFTLLTAVLIFLAFAFSPIRIYPFLLFIILFEIIIWLKLKGLRGLVKAFSRLAIIFLPFLFLLSLPKSTGNYLNGPLVVYEFILSGNYQLLLTPFAGLGYTFLPNDYFPIFGHLTFNNFKDYLFFLISGPVVIYSVFTVLLGFLLTKGKKALWFILGVIAVNVIFEVICYFLITNIRGMTGPNVKYFYEVSTYAIFLGFFIISIAVASLILYLKNKSSILLLSLFLGPIFASAFLWGTWLIIGDNLTFKEGIHWYLTIPPIGSSLFLAGLMTLGFDRIKKVTSSYLKWFLTAAIFFTLLPIFLISNKEINYTFTKLLDIGYGASDIDGMKSQLVKQLKTSIDGKNTLFYFDSSADLVTLQLFYPVTVISGFEQKMHFYNGKIINGCIGLISEKAALQKAMIVKDGIKGFIASSLCVEHLNATGREEIFYTPDRFFAFQLKDKKFIDIKESILQELRF